MAYKGKPAACGTESGYKRHLRHGEKPCSACRDANAALSRQRYGRTEESRAKRREHYRKNRARFNAWQREYYSQNREKIRAQQAAYGARPGSREAQKDRAAMWYQVNGEQVRAAVMARFHDGMTPEAWAALWVAQDGRCYLCGDELERGKKNRRGPHIEHDHSCCGPHKSCRVCRRGLACADCNGAIGYAHDDPARLRRIADALEAAKAAFAVRKAAADEASEQLMLELPA